MDVNSDYTYAFHFLYFVYYSRGNQKEFGCAINNIPKLILANFIGTALRFILVHYGNDITIQLVGNK